MHSKLQNFYDAISFKEPYLCHLEYRPFAPQYVGVKKLLSDPELKLRLCLKCRICFRKPFLYLEYGLISEPY